MKTRKLFSVRLTDYERKQLSYFADKVGLTSADVLRLGLELIQTDTRPSDCKELKKLYEDR